MRNLEIGESENSQSGGVGERKIEAVVQTKTCVDTACSLGHVEPQLRDGEEVRAWVLDPAAMSLSPGYTSYYTYVTFQICKKSDDNSNTYLIGLF